MFPGSNPKLAVYGLDDGAQDVCTKEKNYFGLCDMIGNVWEWTSDWYSRTYYETAELEGVTDPNIVYDLRAKLDASGWYDTFEVDRVAAVVMNPKSTQGDLAGAVGPVPPAAAARGCAARFRGA